ncbi:MAG: trypsin-like serine protease [Bdellovibrionota bacterium]
MKNAERMMRKHFYTIFTNVMIATILFSCGANPNNPAHLSSDTLGIGSAEDSIVGGQKVLDSSIYSKFVVTVLESGGGNCTGVLIARDIVLTAAHCFSEGKPRPSSVFFGAEDGKKIERQVGVLAIHPEYYPTNFPKRHDLAILKLRAPAPEGFKTLNLHIGKKIPSGTVLTALGFGLIDHNQPVETHVSNLKIIRLRVRTIDWRDNSIYSDMTPTHGISHGDSGGPLVMVTPTSFSLVGIASEMTAVHNVAIHTAVGPHLKWIQQTIDSVRGTPKK